MSGDLSSGPKVNRTGLLHRLQERGVLRVAGSYAVIAWLLLQIADVALEPLGMPKWVMTALIIAAVVGFPIAATLAWFLEIGQQGVQVDVAPEGVVRPTVPGLRHYADAIVIGVLLVAVVILLVRQSDLGKPKAPENPAIAVLPFENLSGDPEQEYFSDGLAEEMLDRLGRVPGLRVIARSSSFGFKDSNLDAKTIAERLGVTTVLEGSVQRDGKRLRLSARLIDGATGQQAWSGSFDRELTDIFDVQTELARAVVDAIVPAARGDEPAVVAQPTIDLNAYDLYLLARAQLVLRQPEAIRKSVELSRRAVKLDPDFARVHAHLAASLLLLRMYDDATEQSAALLREAEASIHRALAIDPDLSEAHDAQGNLLRDTERPGAEEAYKRAIELNPNNASAWHDYAVFLGNFADRMAESQRATARSLELDPRQPTTWSNYLDGIQSQGRKRFEEEFARAVRTVGDMPGALSRFPYPIWAQDRAGHRSELSSAIERFKDNPGMLDSLTLPAAAIDGYPVEILRAGILKRKLPAGDFLPVWINSFRAWLPVDLDRAEHELQGQGEGTRGVNYDNVRKFLEADVTGLQGDWARLDRVLGELQAQLGADQSAVRSVMAFWLSVQGRFDEAAASLALAGQVPETSSPPMLGSSTYWGLSEAAMLRTYRATGRSEEAGRLASKLLETLRAARRAPGTDCRWAGWMRYASIAANEGLKDEAVDALQGAMRCGELPFGFREQLPWFRSLEGYAPYDELLRERERRVSRIRQELEQLEAGA